MGLTGTTGVGIGVGVGASAAARWVRLAGKREQPLNTSKMASNVAGTVNNLMVNNLTAGNLPTDKNVSRINSQLLGGSQAAIILY